VASGTPNQEGYSSLMNRVLEQIQSMFPDYANEAVLQAQEQDYLNSILESQLTPEEKEAQLLGLTVAQMNAKTEDMLDSILKSQGENETGFVNESARIAAEGILKGKIAQAGVTDPAAQEAALKSAMESLEGGASGLEAVKAAAGGAQDYVEELLKTAKDIIDKGYDATIGKLPEILTPESILADIISGNVTAVFEIGETGGALPGATSPIFGGTVGTVGGGTNVGIMTTGNAVLDAIIKGAKDGVDGQDIEDIVAVIIASNTGIPKDIIDAGIGGAKSAIEAAKTVVGSSVTGEDDDDTTNVTLTGGAVTTRTCEDGSLVGVNEACPEDTTVTTKTCDDGSVVDITEACPEDTTVTTRTCNSGSVVGINEACPEDLDDPCDNPKYATLNPVECGGISNREIIDDDLTTAFDPCPEGSGKSRNAEGNCVCPGGMIDVGGVCVPLDEDDDDDPCDNPAYAAANQAECGGSVNLCDDPVYAAQNQDKCGGSVNLCDDPVYAAQNQDKCGGSVNLCDDPVYAAQNQDKCGGSVNLCDDPVYAAQNQDKCGGSVNLCDDPVYAAQNQDKCGGSVNLCDDPVYAAQNQDKCGGGVNLCDDPVYAAQNLAKCFTDSGNPCDDPVYAAQNPAKCGTIGGDPCDDPAYAASRPGECGTISGDPCDDPAYAAANPAECGVVVPPGGTAVPTLPTMQGYNITSVKPGEKVGAIDFYDISGPSIFRSGAKTEEEEDPLAYLYSNYADGGIVQDYDIEELIRFLESQRG
jgi:hypothetical protein